MRRLCFVLLFVSFVLAAPALAARKPDVINCSAALQTANICNAGDKVLVIPVSGGGAAGVDAVLLEYALSSNYQATVPCEQTRRSDGRILVAAGVAQADCSSGQVGTTIANPQTSLVYAAALAQKDFQERVQRQRRKASVDGAPAPNTADPSE